ncbi:MAG: NAD-dependent epimerase/dehydratase family protein, partial [Gammaproteobacteria bacterium]|nr:NAD-dependent epimerase/dehydratase family protein [Gammaproteobacteria bacterium]
DVSLKQARLDLNLAYDGYRDVRVSLEDDVALAQTFRQHDVERVVNMAAQAGVRYSLENPRAYVQSNVVGFMNLLEHCKTHNIEHLVYASSSSVYGANTTMPFSVRHNVDHPLSMYATTKKANELMAHTYSHLYELPTTGLRFFTVYGPWGRPDMALFMFTRKILAGEPIDVFNYGQHKRDFTYVDDIVEGVVRVLDKIPTANPAWSGERPDPATSNAPYRLYNIGNSQQEELLRYIEVLEQCLGRKAQKNLLPIQPGDVPETFADVSALVEDVGYRPSTPIEVGVERFVDWYRDYYGV